MSYIDPRDDFPPPPAYSAEEFDRKISTTLQLSLNTAQPQQPLGDDEWEVWDEAAFEAAARALVGSSSAAGSSTLPVEPLKIKKRGPEPNLPSKPRPSWLSQAESPPQDVGTSQHAVSNPPPVSTDIHQLQDEDDVDLPPPAFTPDAPSLDGPPYEQVVSPPWVADGSSLASPLNSPILPNQQLVAPEPLHDIPAPIPPPQPDLRHRSPQPQVNRHLSPQPQANMQHRMSQPQGDMYHRIPRQSLPAAPRTLHTIPQRPDAEYPTYRSPPMPISTFDHSMAYNQESNYGLYQAPVGMDYSPQTPTTDYAYNAAAFYNASVASHLRTKPPQNNPSHHMPGQYYPVPMQRPSDSGPYNRASLTPVRNPATSRFSQYPGSPMAPHLPR